ncbi:MAG: superoxide dismutase [Candidatus Liptonbacteria bacterium]|nr:superoxide dismutase [Candidatus Liptonbacteria bacterium]
MHELPQLPYAYDALEPWLDARTMEIHHAKHHQTYVNKLNEALDKYPEFHAQPLDTLLRDFSQVPEDIRGAVRNHGGGHWNHSLFWTIMAPSDSSDAISPISPTASAVAGRRRISPIGGGEPTGALGAALTRDLGGLSAFRESFSKLAVSIFGSGWAWLVKDPTGKLMTLATSNQDNPLPQGLTPLLTLDVWEHAYYLKYQNRRPEYIENWWSVVNWEEVDRRYRE